MAYRNLLQFDNPLIVNKTSSPAVNQNLPDTTPFNLIRKGTQALGNIDIPALGTNRYVPGAILQSGVEMIVPQDELQAGMMVIPMGGALANVGKLVSKTPVGKKIVSKVASIASKEVPKIFNKAKTLVSPLAQEARKYKSAEEFVKAQGQPIYHGVGYDGGGKLKIEELKSNIHNENFGKGVSFSVNKDTADFHAYKNNVISADKSNLNLYKLSPEEFIFEKLSPKKAKELGLLTKQGKPISFNSLEKYGYDGLDFTGAYDESQTLWRKYYDMPNYQNGIAVKSTEGFLKKDLAQHVPVHNEGEIFVNQKGLEKLKQTKSQLTDFYNQSVKGVEGKVQPILKSTQAIIGKDPVVNLKRDVNLRDVSGNKITLPEGEAYQPHLLSDNKVLLQDGDRFIINKGAYETVKQNAVKAEAKDFAPELKQTEETIKGGNELSRKKEIAKVLAEHKAGKISYNDFSNKMAELNKKGGENPTKFSTWQLPGGENYKEILIKAPTRESQPYNLVDKSSGKVLKTYKNYNEAFADYRDNVPNKTFNAIQPVNSSAPFKSSHWDEPNVISHLRMNERTYNGKKVAFIEELQSDWAREVRKTGGIEADYMVSYRNKSDGTNGIPKVFKTEAEATKYIQELVRKGDAMDIGTIKRGGTPSNPLLKNWQELSIKRALKEAVSTKADYLAWTTGEQQAARYNLSKYVKEIEWEKQTDGTIKWSATKLDGGPGGAGVNSPKDLSANLGKGVAEKIIASTKKSGSITGEGLNIGGEWANNLYDRQVKNIVEDLTGGKVEVLDMKIPIDNKKNVFQSVRENGMVGEIINSNELKVGKSIYQSGEGRIQGRASDNEIFIITDIIGDGKFKAYPKDAMSDLIEKAGGNIDNAIRENPRAMSRAETFDISTKTSQGQQGIMITPEIRAKIMGEAPKLKQPSGVNPIFKTNKDKLIWQ